MLSKLYLALWDPNLLQKHQTRLRMRDLMNLPMSAMTTGLVFFLRVSVVCIYRGSPPRGRMDGSSPDIAWSSRASPLLRSAPHPSRLCRSHMRIPPVPRCHSLPHFHSVPLSDAASTLANSHALLFLSLCVCVILSRRCNPVLGCLAVFLLLLPPSLPPHNTL